MARCAICGSKAEGSNFPVNPPEPASPPDFDTRPGEPLRSAMLAWVSECDECGYCADDLSRPAPGVYDIIASEAYQSLWKDRTVPDAARRLLCYAFLLEKLHQYADSGWTTLQAAWACDDAGNEGQAIRCRKEAIERWKRGKQVGQLFSDDMASEFALVTDLHRRTGDFEHATVACSEGLDLEDVPPPVEAMLRRQMVLIQQRDTSAHSMRELMTPVQPLE